MGSPICARVGVLNGTARENKVKQESRSNHLLPCSLLLAARRPEPMLQNHQGEANGEDMATTTPTYRMIEIFRATMLHGSMTAAAEALGTSQPFVSRTIADLQHALGYALFAKQGRTIKPTVEATALMSKVQQTFVGLEDILRFSEQMKNLRLGRLSISTIPALGHSMMPRMVEDFRAKYPNLIVNLTIASHVEVLRHVRTRQADLGFAAQSYAIGEVESVGKFTAGCVCIGSDRWLNAQAGAVEPEDLRGKPFIALTGALQKRLDVILASTGLELDVVTETSLSITASDLALRGLGIAVVDPYIGVVHRNKGGVTLPLRLDLPYTIQAMAMGDTRLSDPAREVLRRLAAATREAQIHNLQV